MEEAIIHKCHGRVRRFVPVSQTWESLHNDEVADILLFSVLKAPNTETYILAVLSPTTKTPVLVLDLIKENISYFPNKKEIAKNFLTVFYQNDTQERYEVLVSSQNEREAETFAYYMNKLINDGIAGLNKNKMMPQSGAEQRRPPDGAFANTGPPNSRIYQMHSQGRMSQQSTPMTHQQHARIMSQQGVPVMFQQGVPIMPQQRVPGMSQQGVPNMYQQTIPMMTQQGAPTMRPIDRHDPNSYNAVNPFEKSINRFPVFPEYKEIEPEDAPEDEHIYDTLQRIPVVSQIPQSILSKNQENIVKQATSQTVSSEGKVLESVQNTEMEEISKAETDPPISESQKQLNASSMQHTDDVGRDKPIVEDAPLSGPQMTSSPSKNPGGAKIQPKDSPPSNNSFVNEKRKTPTPDSWGAICLILSEAIEHGNVEKAKEFAGQLASRKSKVTIQMLCPEEESLVVGSTINITVQVEDMQSTNPTLVKLDVNPAKTSIGRLKHLVHEVYKFPINVQRWIIGKILPKDNQTLADLNVKTTGTVIFLYLLSANEAGLTNEPSIPDDKPLVPPRDYPKPRERRPPPEYLDPRGNGYQSVPVPNHSPHGFAADQRDFFSIDQNLTNMPQPRLNAGRNPRLPPPPPGGQYLPEKRPSSIPVQERVDDDGFVFLPEVARIPPPPPRKQGWACKGCTFLNIPTRPGCEMCGSDRPADYVPPPDLEIDPREQNRLLQEKELEEMALQVENKRREEERLSAMDNFRNTMQAAEMTLIPNPEPFECQICFQEVEERQGAMLRECLHMFCKMCLIEHIKACEDPEVLCPFNDGNFTCNEVITTQEISALLPEQDFLQYLQMSLNTAENRADNSFHCKTTNCPGWCIYEDAVNTFMCQLCNKKNCLTCKAIHEGMTCQQYQDDIKIRAGNDDAARKTQQMLDELVDRGDAMHCPQCKVILQKKDGCDWLRCSMCRTEICWVTRGRRWGPNGHGDTSGGCKCRINGQPCHPRCGNCH